MEVKSMIRILAIVAFFVGLDSLLGPLYYQLLQKQSVCLMGVEDF